MPGRPSEGRGSARLARAKARRRRREGAAHLLAPRAHLLRLPRDEALPIQLLHHWLPRAGRAVVVPAAADNLAAIGKPPVVDGVSVDSPAERWRAAFEAYFPSKGLKAGVADLSMVEAEQFAEEAVDEMRRQKKMELERMRKEMEQEMLLSEGRK